MGRTETSKEPRTMELQPARQDGCQGSREIRASKPAMKVMSRIRLSRDLSHHSRAQAPGILHLLQMCCLIKMMQHFLLAVS